MRSKVSKYLPVLNQTYEKIIIGIKHCKKEINHSSEYICKEDFSFYCKPSVDR